MSKTAKEGVVGSRTKPLSLQHLIFVHLVTYLDHYQPDAIALLPHRLRQELITFLPPADILQLEQTRVCEGVNMNEIWKHKCQKQTPNVWLCACRVLVPTKYITSLLKYTHEFLKDNGSVTDWREFFIVIACSMLLCARQVKLQDYMYTGECSHDTTERKQESVYTILLQYLFCNKRMPSKQSTKDLCISVCGQNVQLVRYARYTSTIEVPFTLAELAMFLTDVCQAYPKSLVVSCDLCSVSLFCTLPKNELVLKRLLSQLQDLCVTTQYVLPSHQGITHHLNLIISVLSTRLESLRVIVEKSLTEPPYASAKQGYGGDTFMTKLLASIKPFFTPQVLQDTLSPPPRYPVNSPCLGLKRFKVYSDVRQPARNPVSGTNDLFEVVQAQQHLESLEITGCWNWSDKPVVSSVTLDAICSLFFCSNLSIIHLRQLDLPATVVQQLIETFLQSSSKCDFTLYSVWMYGDCECSTSPAVIQDTASGKCLTLQSMYVSNSFIKWLKMFKRIRLKTLVLCDIQYDRDMYPGGIIGALGSHGDCCIESMHLSTHTQYCPREGLDLLLQNPSLRLLQLTGPKHELFDHLLIGLRNQATLGTLLSFSIDQTSFVSLQTSMFGELCTAIFSLPQLEQLTLEFSKCTLLPLQIMSIGKAWKENGRRQLKMFVLCVDLPQGFSKSQEPTFLQEMAKEVRLNIRTPNKQ